MASLPNAYVGARHTGLSITWRRADGSIYDLTGATITARIADGITGANPVNSSGTFTVVTPTAGVFTWAYSAADVATPGIFQVQFKATYGDGTFDVTQPQQWQVISVL